MHVTAIIAAGGRGQRLGGAQPKQFLAVAGRAILERSVARFLAHPAVDEVVVALPPETVSTPPAYLMSTSKPVHIVAGGPRRQDSVSNAFHAVSERSDVIVVHDAARPFASADLITRTIAAAAESGAAVAAIRSRDTVKRAVRDPAVAPAKAPGPAKARLPREAPSFPVDPASAGLQNEGMSDPASAGLRVAETLPREWIFLAQTPQAFRRDVLRDALALAGEDATDEAVLAERAGHTVRIVEGEHTNIKITTAGDVAIAEAIARSHDGTVPVGIARIGTGYDLHRMVEGRPLILGGVTIPFDRGLLGHSDADAICHAVTDAILGAAGAGDIGRLFPDTDPKWKDASSIDLLRLAAAGIAEHGYVVGNVDVVVIAERPKLGPFIETMRKNVADAINVGVDRISIKGKTNEGVGEIGRGEAIAVHAIALVEVTDRRTIAASKER